MRTGKRLQTQVVLGRRLRQDARVPAEVPASLTYTFYALVAWGLSAMFAAFRILAGDSLQRSIAMRVVILLWLGVPMILAVRGVLFDFSSSPPNLLRLVVPMMVAVVILCASPWGRYAAAKLPTTLLVGTQTFRLPLEIVLYGLAARGLLGREMTLSGYNFDIIVGALALPLWWALRTQRAPLWSVWVWNALGLGLLLIGVTLAILGFPMPFGWFEPPNVIVAFFPWVWLPTFLVPLALGSHLLLFRKLLLPMPEPGPNV